MGELLNRFKRLRPEQWEQDHVIIPARSQDMKWLELLMCYTSQLGDGYAGDVIRERAYRSGNKRMWAMWRCAQGMMLKVMDGIYDTMPYRNMKHIVDMADNGEIHMQIKTVNRHNKGNTLLANEDLTVILHAALQGECSICMRSGKECSQCQLRKVLSVYLPPDDYPVSDICPYAHGEID